MSTAALQHDLVRTALVCAPRTPSQEPLIALAERCYETDTERVFLREGGREVMRLPLSAPVVLRPVRQFPGSDEREHGELALLRAIGRARSAPSGDVAPTPEGQVLAQTFASALRAGDAESGSHLAALLAARCGAADVFEAMSDCLADLGQEWAQGRSPVLAERAATHAAISVCDRLAARLPTATVTGTVVLAVPPGERHTLALGTLAHLLREAGRQVYVVDDLPLEELAQLAAEPDTAAVVLSAHVHWSAAAARRLFMTLRAAAPDVLLVAGGPGLPGTASVGADVVTQDIAVLLGALAATSSALTPREREVLMAVADGLTNPEIAVRLHVSTSTVRTHLDHVLTKTGAAHRAAAVAQALRRGWIT